MLFKQIQSSTNPETALKTIIESNPQLQQTLQTARQYGEDPKSAFYNLAKAKGINPENILRLLK